MKIKARAWAIALCVIIAASVIMAGLIPQEVEAKKASSEEMRSSVACISNWVQDTSGNQMIISTGTCFFVGDPKEDPVYLVTNHHVIYGTDKVPGFLRLGAGEWYDIDLFGTGVLTVKATMRVYFNKDDYQEAYVVSYDASRDIAILKLDNPTSERKAVQLKIPTNDDVSSQVYCAGYPGLSDNLRADPVSSWDVGDVSITAGTISRLFTSSGSGFHQIQTDAKIQHGNSGGPMFNENGYVVGVNYGKLDNLDISIDDNGNLSGELENLNYAVNIDEVISLLESENIAYVMAKNGPDKMIIFIIAAIIVLLVIILAAVIVSASNKKKKKEKEQQRLQMQAAQQAQAAQAAEAQRLAMQQNQKRGSIRSLAAQHQGATFAVAGQTVIGRDPSACAVVFSDGTPGVSGKHATVAFDPNSGEFLLTDLGSTYGTFLATGQKLEPNRPYRLVTGDSFYLGEKANSLRLESE